MEKYLYKQKIMGYVNFGSFLYNHYYDKLNPDINLFNTSLTKEKLLSTDKLNEDKRTDYIDIADVFNKINKHYINLLLLEKKRKDINFNNRFLYMTYSEEKNQ